MSTSFKCIVVVATFNGEKYLGMQLNSILSQKKCEPMIIVFDDGSSDNTINILRKFESKHKNISIRLRSLNSGSAAHNFMKGISELFYDSKISSNYDYYSFCDQDDIWHDYKLFNAINKLEKKSSDLYFSDLIKFNNKTNLGIIKKSHKIRKYDYLFEGGSAGCTYVFNSKLLNECVASYNKINFKNWKHFSHDWFVYFIARKNNLKVTIDNNSFIDYRIHESNVHGDMNTLSIKGIFRKIRFIKDQWYNQHASNYIKLISPNSIEYEIYRSFLKDSIFK